MSLPQALQAPRHDTLSGELRWNPQARMMSRRRCAPCASCSAIRCSQGRSNRCECLKRVGFHSFTSSFVGRQMSHVSPHFYFFFLFYFIFRASVEGPQRCFAKELINATEHEPCKTKPTGHQGQTLPWWKNNIEHLRPLSP